MTRFWLWILLSAGGAVGAFFGICMWGTAGEAGYFMGVAFFLHYLFGEEA